MIQLSILKITGYGPWTLTLGSDREHELQMLQASLYKEVQRLFSSKGCLVFLNRADEFFAVSNGLNLADHVQIQQTLEKSFDIKLSISIGCGESPYAANLQAYEGKKNNIILDSKYNIFGYVDESPKSVSIMHLDVDGLTSKRKSISPYETSSMIFDLYAKMSKYFLEKKSLTFFMGGDNFMVIANEEAKNSIRDFIEFIKNTEQITLNCGIGTAQTARYAVKLATKSLDTIREIRDSGKEKPDIYELTC